jgi:hypothetical protein
MMDAEWTELPIYKPIVHTTNILRANGYSDERVCDALFTVALSWARHQRGSRRLSQRLWLLAQKFADDADRVEWGSDGLH